MTGIATRVLSGSTAGSRTNLGIINSGFPNSGPVDADALVSLIDGETGNQLTSFQISDRIGRKLGPGEPVQLGDLFADPAVPATVKRLSVVVEGGFLTGYLSTVDNATNDATTCELNGIFTL